MFLIMRLDRFFIFHKPGSDEKPRKLAAELGITLARRRRIGDDDRLAAANRGKLFAHKRAQPALDLVAHDRLADLVRYGKTHPHGARGRENQNDVRFGQPFAVAVNVRERTVFIQPVRLVKQLLAERSGRKVLSALVATVFKHASAALCLHSLTKAVHLALLTFFGLISSFHDILRNAILRDSILPNNYTLNPPLSQEI